jgi:hypothetical protein
MFYVDFNFEQKVAEVLQLKLIFQNKKAIKTIPAFKPLPSSNPNHSSDEEENREALSPSKSPKESSGLNSTPGASLIELFLRH